MNEQPNNENAYLKDEIDLQNSVNCHLWQGYEAYRMHTPHPPLWHL